MHRRRDNARCGSGLSLSTNCELVDRRQQEAQKLEVGDQRSQSGRGLGELEGRRLLVLGMLVLRMKDGKYVLKAYGSLSGLYAIIESETRYDTSKKTKKDQ